MPKTDCFGSKSPSNLGSMTKEYAGHYSHEHV